MHAFVKQVNVIPPQAPLLPCMGMAAQGRRCVAAVIVYGHVSRSVGKTKELPCLLNACLLWCCLLHGLTARTAEVMKGAHVVLHCEVPACYQRVLPCWRRLLQARRKKCSLGREREQLQWPWPRPLLPLPWGGEVCQ